MYVYPMNEEPGRLQSRKGLKEPSMTEQLDDNRCIYTCVYMYECVCLYQKQTLVEMEN